MTHTLDIVIVELAAVSSGPNPLGPGHNVFYFIKWLTLNLPDHGLEGYSSPIRSVSSHTPGPA